MHPDGYSIFDRWKEQDGPRFWRFPLKANRPIQAPAALPTPPPVRPWTRPSLPLPASPIQAPATLPTPPPARPLTAALAAQSHPSQGFCAINNAGQACLVTFMYSAAQAMALAAQSSRTPFDPCSLDLPSIGALVGFYHACMGFPVKHTWLEAIKAGNCDSFKGLTYSNVARYCPDLDETIMGHLSQ
jgi:hypothetical protein